MPKNPGNRQRGREPLDRPFTSKRAPGTLSAGETARSLSPVSCYMAVKCKSVLHAAQIVVKKFGVPRSLVNSILARDTRNSFKYSRLVEIAQGDYKTQRRRRRSLERRYAAKRVCQAIRRAELFGR